MSGFCVGSVRRQFGDVCVKLLLYLCQCIVLFTHDTSISDQEINREATVLRLSFRLDIKTQVERDQRCTKRRFPLRILRTNLMQASHCFSGTDLQFDKPDVLHL